MPDNIVYLNCVTRLDIPVDRVLEEAKGKIDDGVIVLGWDKEGDIYFASSMADNTMTLWLLESAKLALLR